MSEIKLLAVVALLADIPEHGLRRGQVGTVIENLAHGVYEVEFVDNQGQTYASLGIEGEKLLPLQFDAVDEAA